MIYFLLFIFLILLIRIGLSNNLVVYIRYLVLQGIVLFGLAFFGAEHEENILAIIFVLIETILIKATVIPMFLRYIMKKNKLKREAAPHISYFVSGLIIVFIIVFSFWLSYHINSDFEKMSFAVAISTILIGIFMIISRTKIITHIIGYLVIENGIFLLSLSVGHNISMYMSLAISMDIFATILVFGLFLNKISNTFHEMNSSNLITLKD